MTKRNIPLYKVFMSPAEVLMPELQKVLYSGMVTEGAKVKEFEEAFQKKFNLNIRPLSVNSGTSALQLAYRCCNVKDKIVIASPMDCFANVTAILNEGAKIVWADIDPKTGNISAEDVKKKIEIYGKENIAAVSFVDIAGYPADLDSLDVVCEEIPLVQDCAQSLGSQWNGKWAGQNFRKDLEHDLYCCFSFQAIKSLTTNGDGGMLVIHQEFAEYNSWQRAKKLKWFSIDREAAKEATRWSYDISEIGYKMHMNNVSAVSGLVQLSHIDAIINRHKQNGKWFDEQLKNIDGIKLAHIPTNSSPNYWIYFLRVQNRENFAKMMDSKGIAVNIAHTRNDSYSVVKSAKYVLNHWEPLYGMNEYEKDYIFSPCGWWVSDADREYIVDSIKSGW